MDQLQLYYEWAFSGAPHKVYITQRHMVTLKQSFVYLKRNPALCIV